MCKIMSYREFLTYIQHRIEAVMDNNTRVMIHKVLKNNNLELDGISIMESNTTTSPTIYLNDFYEDYLNGGELGQIIHDILNIHSANNTNIPFHIEEFKQYELMKKKLACKLIHYRANRKLLNHVPHKRFLDLAQVFYIIVQSDEFGTASILIRREYLKLWNITEHQLCYDAIQNSPHILPATIIELNKFIDHYHMKDDLSDELFNFIPIDYPDFTPSQISMYILTNQSLLNGAATLLYPTIIHSFAERMNTDIYILPSSIHEVILVPDYGGLSKESLSHMVKTINQEEVEEHEQLSDRVYLYHKNSRTFHM